MLCFFIHNKKKMAPSEGNVDLSLINSHDMLDMYLVVRSACLSFHLRK